MEDGTGTKLEPLTVADREEFLSMRGWVYELERNNGFLRGKGEFCRETIRIDDGTVSEL